MPAKKKVSAPPVTPPSPEEPSSSEEVQVLAPASEEPVRRGGYVLTEDGWVLDNDGPPVEVLNYPDEENQE